MRFLLSFLTSLLVVLFVAGGLGSVPTTNADNPYGVCADFNGDGLVGIIDIALVVQRFGMTDESPDWDPRFDLHRGTNVDRVFIGGEGVIEVVDIAFAVARFGDVCTQPAEKITFETILQGTARSGIGVPPLVRVARDEQAWEALWEEHWTAGEPPPLPAVNFQQEMVAAVVDYAPKGGTWLFISGVLSGEEEWVVQATVLACGNTQILTWPHHIVRLPRTDLPISLSLSRRTDLCPSA